MGRIFISYRREDSADAAGRLFDRLASRFGSDGVFMDVDGIPVGVDFRTHLEGALADTTVLLAVMGDDWLTATTRSGTRRIDEPDDYVRTEIETGIRRGMTVIPVLVGEAAMPPAELLPESIRELAFRNAATVRSGPDFPMYVDRLVSAVEKAGIAQKPAPLPSTSAPSRRRRPLALGIVGAIVVLAALTWALWPPPPAGQAVFTLECVPNATVMVDGRARGETPMTIYLDAGAYEVGLRRPGFETRTERLELSGGERRTFSASLVLVDLESEAALAVLSDGLGVEYTPFEAPVRTRSGWSRDPASLLWPQQAVSRSSLTTLCIEFTPEWTFEGAQLGFKKGETWLHREEVVPTNDLLILVIPSAVLDAIEPGDEITWGLWEADGSLIKSAPLHVMERDAAKDTGRRRAALEEAEGFRGQKPIVQRALQVEFLLRAGLRSEAFRRAWSMREEWPESTLSTIVAAKAAARLDLQRTDVMQQLQLECWDSTDAWKPLLPN